MKNASKPLVALLFSALLLFIGFFSETLQAQTHTRRIHNDTIFIEFGDSSQMVLYLKNQQDFEDLKETDLNALVVRLGQYLDSAGKQTESLEIEVGEGTEKQVVQMEVEERQEKGKKFFQFRISKKEGVIVKTNLGLGRNHYVDTTNKTRVYHYRRTRQSINFDFGLNNYLENGNTPKNTPYDLRPLGSRYFAVAPTFKTQLFSKNSPFIIQYGLEFSWYNFMFAGNRRVSSENGLTFFDSPTDLKKTKLVAAYASLPFLMHVDLAKDNRTNLKLAFGGYAGYRVGSYTKIVYSLAGDRQKEKEHNPYDLNDFRYGVRLELGIGESRFDSGVRLFATYDFNTLFASETSPQLNTFVFGVRI
ncbi:outer membrane beta-barrel protein [Hugenholtzia roseola]|uniref:outer membrane beta-barrel protein n=1 Tax=Hugenholtzia roseola TaxID=1002 RepID=UPI0003FE9DAC|nr:outer membrane beta-barrel protein [Hugenholtzia roseola]